MRAVEYCYQHFLNGSHCHIHFRFIFTTTVLAYLATFLDSVGILAGNNKIILFMILGMIPTTIVANKVYDKFVSKFIGNKGLDENSLQISLKLNGVLLLTFWIFLPICMGVFLALL